MRNTSVLGVGVLLLLALAAPSALAEDEGPPPGGGRGGGPGGGRGGSAWDRVKAFDADGDGVVTREEFQGPDRLFDRLDADGDGSVTQAEAEAVRGRRGSRQGGGRREPAAAAPAGVTLELVDANRDGAISLGEWTEFFAAADCDGDGRVSAEEWKQMLAPTTRPGGTAPAVGSKAPVVRAVPLGGGEAIDLAAPKRTTVLVFGSWT